MLSFSTSAYPHKGVVPYPAPSVTSPTCPLRACAIAACSWAQGTARVAGGSSLQTVQHILFLSRVLPGVALVSRAQLCALQLGFFRNVPSSSQSRVFLLSSAIGKNVILILEHSWKLALLYRWPLLTILYLWQKPTNFTCLIRKHLPSRHSKKIYMCYIHYYIWDCFCFSSCSNSNSFKVGRVHSVCFIASACLHNFCHHGSILYLHQSSRNWSSVWSNWCSRWKKEEARRRICWNRYRRRDVADKDVNARKPVEDELGPSSAWLVSPGGKTLLDSP